MNRCLIDGLPSEILSHIFVSLNEASLHARSISDDSYGLMHYPTLCSSVCSRWRRIALRTPHLWSYLDYTTAGNKLQHLDHVDLSFHRAQSVPLRIRIGKFSNPCMRLDIGPRLESNLRSSAPRLQSLAILCIRYDFMKRVLSTLFSEGVIVPLAALALEIHSESRTVTDSKILPQGHLNQLFEPLHSLYLQSILPDWSQLSCRNLVELQILYPPEDGTPNTQQLVNLLRANQTLRSIKFCQFDHPSTPPRLPYQSILLPNLEKLDLNGMDKAFIDWFLSGLVPGSHDLEISLAFYPMKNRPDITDSLLALCKRARITSFEIWGDELSLSPFYDHLPHLRNLRLTSRVLLKSTLAGLQKAVHPLPQLDTLELISFFPDD
ncbi:hypothetical protein FRC12_014757 [Ceratobasidium sp. 428]|nr:hypothetical protein FRC12_014757 [Ceratobasidium sp. 428]